MTAGSTLALRGRDTSLRYDYGANQDNEDQVMGDARFKVARDDVYWREVDEILLILHMPTSRYLQLNASAIVLWESVVEGATEAELRTALMERYGIAAERAEADVATFLEPLRRDGLITVDEPG